MIETPRPRSKVGHPMLLLGSVSTGLLGAVYIVIAENSLEPVDFAAITHLWTIWSISGAVLTFSLQQWIIVRTARNPTTRKADLLSGRVAAVCVLPVLVVFAVTGIYRSQLFESESLCWPAAAAAIPLGAIGIGAARGLWSARDRLDLVGVIVAGENAIRCALVIPVAVLWPERAGFVLALLAGFVVALVLPTASSTTKQPKGGQTEAVGLLAVAAGSGLMTHLTVSGAPTILAISGGDAEAVSRLFVLLSVCRVPLLVAVGLIPAFSVHFARLVSERDHRAINRWTTRIGLAVVLIGVAGSAAAAAVLPDFIEAIFGVDVRPSALEAALAASLVAVIGGVMIASTALIAEDSRSFLILLWSMPVTAGSLRVLTAHRLTPHDLLVVALLVGISVFIGATALSNARRLARHLPPA